MNIGILGGTFDPPHLGHLALARAALATGQVEQVLLIPTAIPPHKTRSDISSPQHRLAMARLLADIDQRLIVSDIEIRRNGASYSIDTVRELMLQQPEDKFRLVIGADMAIMFDQWRNAEELIEIACPLIAARPGFSFPEGFGSTLPENITESERKALLGGVFSMKPFSVSSTEIREACFLGQDLSDYIPESIIAYIKTHKLYQNQ